MTRSSAGGADLPFAHLAAHLTALRRAARLTQRALTEAANISRGAVQRAESGTTAPSAAVLDAYLRACGADPAATARARLLRNRGRAAERGRLDVLDAPAPALIRDRADLAAALAVVYELAGAPPLRELSLPGRAPLPPTTAWRIVHRKGLPATVRQMLTFLTACGVRPAEQRPYIDAYHRVTADHDMRPAPARTRPVPPRGRRAARRTHTVPLAYGGIDDRYELTGQAAAMARQLPPAVLDDLLTNALDEMVYEAHRNGIGLAPADAGAVLVVPAPDVTIAPDWLVRGAADTADDRGVDLVVRTPDGRTVPYQVKSHYQHRPGPPPEALGTRIPQPPPPRPAPAAHAA